MISVCRRPSVGSKLCAKMLRELCTLCERKNYPHTPTMFFFSQKNTEEQNTQHSTETLSQPITQNLTATFSCNVLWYLYAGGLLWVRNSVQKGSVKSVSSVREKTPHELNSALKCSVKSVTFVRDKTPLQVSKMFFFSQRTQMNRTHKGPQRH